MPVQRFRSFEEAKDALWGTLGDPAYLRRVAWLWAFSDRICPPKLRAGVRRYRSITDTKGKRLRPQKDGGNLPEASQGGTGDMDVPPIGGRQPHQQRLDAAHDSGRGRVSD